MTAIANSAEYREQIAALGIEPQVTRPREFAEFMKSDIARWSRAIKDTGLTLN